MDKSAAQTRLAYLMKRYFEDEIEEIEKAELWAFVNDPVFSEEVRQLIPDATSFDITGEPGLTEQQEEKILSLILEHDTPIGNRSKRYLVLQIASVAALLLISFSLWFWNDKMKSDMGREGVIATNDVAPGTYGATLTLSDGREVNLIGTGNGEIAKEAGIKIVKQSNGELTYILESSKSSANTFNTLTTAKGQTYQILLPDGSKVWLNAASELRYRANLVEEGKREVFLKGEAYFEIAKDKAHPFLVTSKGQTVQVLGTKFNVNVYEEEPQGKTALIEGSIQLSTGDDKRILKPGQLAATGSGKINVRQADVEESIDWKDGDFSFKSIDLKSALRKVERWYDVEMIYDSDVPMDLQAGGWISRKKNLSSVLAFIESAHMVQFRIEGKKVYVSKY